MNASETTLEDGTVVELKPYLAHVRRNDDGSFAIHDFEEQLRAVWDLGEEELR